VYFLLDATVNPEAPNAENSKCGLYLKIANLNVRQPVDMKVLLYRGSTAVGSSRRLESHNMWALEFNSTIFPNYDLLQNRAEKNLNNCFLFSDVVTLPGTWENVALCCVPVVGADGTFYGICGFEVSALFFRLYHAQSGAFPHMAGLLAAFAGDGIAADKGLQTGDRTGYAANLSGELSVKQDRFFNIYETGGGARFVGVQTSIKTSPLGGVGCLSVMIPKADYDAESGVETRENLLILLLLVLSAVFGVVVMSKLYIKPILSGINRMKNRDPAAERSGASKATNVQEIDDLMDFLAGQDEVRETERREWEQKLNSLGVKAEKEKIILPTREAYGQFLRSLETLTLAEREVFDLYAEGKRAKDMPGLLYRSENTIKTHNKHIYDKLCVSSRGELLGYIKVMKGEVTIDEPDHAG
jgi:DNA-binding CsgD family transcriptional regulator